MRDFSFFIYIYQMSLVLTIQIICYKPSNITSTKKTPIRRFKYAPFTVPSELLSAYVFLVKKHLSKLAPKKKRLLAFLLERVMGIEPTWLAWEARALPLSYTRILYSFKFFSFQWSFVFCKSFVKTNSLVH